MVPKKALEAYRLAGMRLKDLAPQLNCSSSLLSYLLRAGQAPAEDRELARCGDISTRELVRRARSSGDRSTPRRREAIEFARERAAAKACQAIWQWFDHESIAGADQGQVIELARLHLLTADKSTVGSLEAGLPDMPLNGVVRLFRPAYCGTTEDRTAAWLARWLALWALHGISDDRVRARALELACGEEAHL